MKLEEWLFSELMVGFKDKILPVSPEVALLTGQMMGEGKRRGGLSLWRMGSLPLQLFIMGLLSSPTIPKILRALWKPSIR